MREMDKTRSEGDCQNRKTKMTLLCSQLLYNHTAAEEPHGAYSFLRPSLLVTFLEVYVKCERAPPMMQVAFFCNILWYTVPRQSCP